MPRVRRVASGRTKDASCDDVTTIAVIPRRSRLTPVDERLVERRAAVRLDRGQQLEDLEPLARAAVGRERPSSGGR